MADNNINKTNHAIGRLKITLIVILTAIIIYLFIALFSFNINDPGWSSISSETTIKNYAGPVGAYISSFILAIFGIIGFILPFLLIDFVRILLLKRKQESLSYLMFTIKTIGIITFILSCCGLSELYLNFFNYWVPQRSGGILGYETAKFIIKYLGTVGGSFTLLITLSIGLILYSGTTWIYIFKNIIMFLGRALNYLTKARPKDDKDIPDINGFDAFEGQTTTTKNLEKNNPQEASISLRKDENSKKDDIFRDVLENTKVDNELSFKDPKKESSTDIHEETISELDIDFDDNEDSNLFDSELTSPQMTKEDLRAITQTQSIVKPLKKANLPSLDLLTEPEPKQTVISQAQLNETSSLLEQTLNDFNINAKVVAAYPGPVITRYEIDLARGTKVSKLTNIAQDLARALSTTAVRVVEVIPGKPYVGLELPNPTRQMVRIKEVLASPEFMKSKAPTLMGIGVDISGKPTFAELAKMPHLLVAGTTGSGKSVGVNAMILSMLYKCSPDELKFIMIDPKMLELSIYDGIPHLLTPVVTDMTEAANSLRWCVKEMERRYALMSATGVRNIALLNDKIEQAEKAGRPLKDTMFIKMNPERAHEAPLLTKMPYIVVVADEFADMIMVVGKKVEELIARLAQKARAAGIHIILATQRPSVDVVTGLIKANIPTRMSFQVSSRIDSRTILDQQGAEQLLGQGDMLYLKPGFGAPMRIHGAFVDDNEVHRVVESWKEYGEPDYVQDILEASEDADNGSGSSGSNGDSEDPLYNEAVEIVIKTQKASISAVQRKLKIGYNRSARLMEEMEENGIVSEMNQNGMREVLIKRDS
ncbi:DNA translocase FtsK 4TM domain-containing protein [Francisella philomiragia]|uniref:DNA translocase FtsK n=1 Tax=Francisella philomiragia subsp. philomiragia (strain ATCC 25017 / CCUG 19701 / FSC 153 / O\|nr:DNA translocase FtsK [Francisella philomiragia]AJI47800.1 DNA translocase ftsK [Francisella philomiragia]AJI50076.1 DNA translocase ftsK [Francisella philomiragia]MBK2019790.1 DNA translocase FtsK 4TM domain-containing protein [Francisella philomiragia]MBK2029756.1 DNA translocase FtsK 4TM domain-containing protein [Francisella philomiragia]MBK2263692.1 DNA translocase FtsK 4TM domain-containing protein [Francisella philomiragia]